MGQNPFPEAPGRDTVFLVCSQCHSIGKMAGADLTADDWQFVVYDMIARVCRYRTTRPTADVANACAACHDGQYPKTRAGRACRPPTVTLRMRRMPTARAAEDVLRRHPMTVARSLCR
jgi:hypothetical protein